MTADAGWHILPSTMIRAVAYDAPSQQLRVRFAGGAIYRYHGVPAAVVQTLLDPPEGSAGRWFNDAIRDAYEYDEER